jgi:aminoglycoside phosphotransferase (APT) family kinase protein
VPNVADIAQRLAANSGKYFPDLAGSAVRAELRRTSRREAGVVYHFELVSGGECHSVVVKLPRVRSALGHANGNNAGQPADRPRLLPLCSVGEKCRWEHDALKAISGHFSALNDPRFDAVSVLDLWTDEQAVVMRAVMQPRLRELLREFGRSSRDESRLQLAVAIRHSGAWLREFHQLPPLRCTQPRHARQADFLEAIGRWVDFLAAPRRDAADLRVLASRIKRTASRHLPHEMPLGLVHGDFAPRNVFVGASGRVTVFDTQARSLAPIYEDLGSFLVEMRWNTVRRRSLGWIFTPPLMDIEQAFLSGYFASEAVPLTAVRLFEIQWLLQKWCSQEYACRKARGLDRMMTPLRRAMMYGMRRQIESVLSALEAQSQPAEIAPQGSAVAT